MLCRVHAKILEMPIDNNSIFDEIAGLCVGEVAAEMGVGPELSRQ